MAKNPDWARGMPPADWHQCKVFWQSKHSGSWLRCNLSAHHEGACRAVNGWRDETEATQPESDE